MLDPRDTVVEGFGLYFERFSLPRILGRMYGLLLITHEPFLGLDQMAEQLGISKASSSTSARQLQAFTLIEKLSLPGDRRDYYRVAPDAHLQYLRNNLEQSLDFSKLIRNAANLENLSAEARAKLKAMEHLYDGLTQVIDGFFETYTLEAGLDGSQIERSPPSRLRR